MRNDATPSLFDGLEHETITVVIQGSTRGRNLKVVVNLEEQQASLPDAPGGRNAEVVPTQSASSFASLGAMNRGAIAHRGGAREIHNSAMPPECKNSTPPPPGGEEEFFLAFLEIDPRGGRLLKRDFLRAHEEWSADRSLDPVHPSVLGRRLKAWLPATLKAKGMRPGQVADFLRALDARQSTKDRLELYRGLRLRG